MLKEPSGLNVMPWPFYQQYHPCADNNIDNSDDPWKHVEPLHIMSAEDWDREEDLRQMRHREECTREVQLLPPFWVIPKVVASCRQWQYYRTHREQRGPHQQPQQRHNVRNKSLNSQSGHAEIHSMGKNSTMNLVLEKGAPSRNIPVGEVNKKSDAGAPSEKESAYMTQWYSTKNKRGWLSTPSRGFPSKSVKSIPSQQQQQQQQEQQLKLKLKLKLKAKKKRRESDDWLSDPDESEDDKEPSIPKNSLGLNDMKSYDIDMKENLSPSKISALNETYEMKQAQTSTLCYENRDDERNKDNIGIDDNCSVNSSDSNKSVVLIQADDLPPEKVQQQPPTIAISCVQEHVGNVPRSSIENSDTMKQQHKSTYPLSFTSTSKSTTSSSTATQQMLLPKHVSKLKRHKKRSRSLSPHGCRSGQAHTAATTTASGSTVTPTDGTTPLHRRRTTQPTPSFQPIAKGWERRLTQMSLTDFMGKGTLREKK